MRKKSNLNFQTFWGFPPFKRARILIPRGSKHIHTYLQEFVYPNNFLKQFIIWVSPFYYNTVKFASFFKGKDESVESGEIMDFNLRRKMEFVIEKLGAGTSKEVEMGVYLGSEGKFNKKTLLIIDKSSGEPLFFVKIACNELGKYSLAKEINTLKKLKAKNIKFAVFPEIMEIYEDEGKIVVFKYQKGFKYCPNSRLRGFWVDFLVKVFKAFLIEKRIQDTKRYKENLQKLEFLKKGKETFIKKFILEIWEKLENNIDHIPSVVGMVHGDFKPFNIKRNKEGKFLVFDWEWSIEEWIPFYDVFHFLISTKNYSSLEEFLNSHEVQEYTETMQDILIGSDEELLKTYFFLYSFDYLLNYSIVVYSDNIESTVDDATIKIMNLLQKGV